MSIPLVDLQAQFRTIKAEVEQAVGRVMEKCDFILGGAVGEFETAFAKFIGAKHAIGVASGTDALFLSLKALNLGAGDKVLLPANTFIATALAVSYAGATPVLCDVDPLSHTLDVASARKALTAGVKAIMPVHLYGQAANMEPILDFAREKGLQVIEDAAQAHGAVHKKGRCGTFGVASGFSFYPGKNLGAYGDGGAICTNDDALADRIKLLRNWGSTVKYIHRLQGFNSRLDTMQAAVLNVKLRYLADWNARRRTIAGWYRELLQPLSAHLELPQEAPWSQEHIYHIYLIQLKKADRDAVLKKLQAAGVGAGIHYPVPIHLQEAYRTLNQGPGTFPVTEAAARRILSLPIYPEMTRAQAETVAGTLGRILAE